MLPEVFVGDKVVYNHEHEGEVTDIQSPLGYKQFTVKLLNGYTRICARYQIEKIDRFFDDAGPNDEDLLSFAKIC